MIVVPERLLAGWFRGDTYGVNAIAAALPRRTLSGNDAAPPTVHVLNARDDKPFATTGIPSTLPALVVWGDTSKLIARGSRTTKRLAKLGAGLYTKDASDAAKWNGAFDVIARAVESSLVKYNSATLSAEYRDLNGIHVDSAALVDVQQIMMAGETGTPVLWGFLTIEAPIEYATA